MNINTFSNNEIINLYSESIKELKKRNIIRTKNITGELGEYIAIQHYNETSGLPNLQLAPPGTENIDALSRKGERYSVKTITTNGSTGTFNGLPQINSDNTFVQKFEYVIIVKLTDSFELERILELSWDDFIERKKWHKTMKAWNLSYSNKLVQAVKKIY